MVGVLGLEDSDLGLEIIELLSGGHSSIDGMDGSVWHRMRGYYAQTANIKQPFSVGARALDNSLANPSSLAMHSKHG